MKHRESGFVKGAFDKIVGEQPSHQVRDYDETEGVGALLRRHFGFDSLEKIAREPNSILKELQFKPVNSPSYRYQRQDGPGGTVTGRTSHLHPNPSAMPKQGHPNISEINKAPRSSQPQRDVQMLVEALLVGRTLEDAKAVAELVTFPAWSGHYIKQTILELPPAEIMRKLHQERSIAAAKAKAEFLQPLMDTCSATPPGQEKPKVKISIYLDDGIVFDYDVANATSAREHVSAIIKTGYRHSDSETPDELTHFPPHRILKVKMRGPGITTMYYDRPRGT
jgi:hypothetical protein